MQSTGFEIIQANHAASRICINPVRHVTKEICIDPFNHVTERMIDMNDQDYMRRAIELARKGRGWTSPNPLVGAVIVKDGRIIGEGYHRRYGELHAERNAIASLTESAEGATIYVTLEPCCHYGKTPPCTEAILEQKIARVVIGSRDPNPLVAGKGARILREHGLIVEEDFLRQECDQLNPVFFHYISTGLPYVVMKYAMTLDGKIASYTGASKWITGEKARAHVHDLRGSYSAILAGIGTVLADDPMLNCRRPGAHQPLRIVVDSSLRISPDSQLVRTAREFPLLIAYANAADEKAALLQEMGAETICLPDDKGQVDLKALMTFLGKRKIDSVLIEGGGQIHEAALQADIVNHVSAYIAPKLLGGRDARTPVEGLGAASPDEGAKLTNLRITQLGEDLLLDYDLERGMNHVHRNC